MAISTLTEQDWNKEVLRAKEPVVVALRAGWCRPSQQMAPFLDDVADRYRGRAKVMTIDVGDAPTTNKICRRYKVTRLPVVMAFRGGHVVDVIGGAASTDTVLDMIERQVRPVPDVDEFTFDSVVLKSPVPVLVHVDAAWCDASRALVPSVEAAADKYRGRAGVVRLEYGPANARLCARYGFSRVPVLALFHEGELRDQILGGMEGGTKTEAVRTSCVGLTTDDNIAQMLDRLTL